MTATAEPQAGPQISLPTGSAGFRVSVVSDDDPDTARHKRWRETVLFGAALGMFAAAFVVSVWFAFLSAHPDGELRRSALGIVVTLIGALAGFLGGRASK